MNTMRVDVPGRSKPLLFASVLAFALSGCGADSEAREGSELEGHAPEALVADVADEGPATSPEPEQPAEAAPSAAASPPASEPPPPPARLIPEGTTLVFEVVEEISTSSHRAGDTFRLRLVEGVAGVGGASLREGLDATGEVTESERSAGSDQPALLAVRLASVDLAGGLPLEATVESADMESGTRDSGTRTAATIATGAAAGAVVGRILGGDTRSTVVGAAVGAAAGTGIALTTRDGHAVIPEGALLTVRLDAPLMVP